MPDCLRNDPFAPSGSQTLPLPLAHSLESPSHALTWPSTGSYENTPRNDATKTWAELAPEDFRLIKPQCPASVTIYY